MRRLNHLAILPIVFLIFTEAGPTVDGDRTTIIDAQNVEIRPVSEATRRANPRVLTEIRSGRGTLYGLTAPTATVVEKFASPQVGVNTTIDLRVPPATPTPIEVR